jgi:hypothetical protein
MAVAEARAERSMERLQAMLGPDGGLADAALAGDAARSPACSSLRQQSATTSLLIGSHAIAVFAASSVKSMFLTGSAVIYVLPVIVSLCRMCHRGSASACSVKP